MDARVFTKSNYRRFNEVKYVIQDHRTKIYGGNEKVRTDLKKFRM